MTAPQLSDTQRLAAPATAVLTAADFTDDAHVRRRRYRRPDRGGGAPSTERCGRTFNPGPGAGRASTARSSSGGSVPRSRARAASS